MNSPKNTKHLPELEPDIDEDGEEVDDEDENWDDWNEEDENQSNFEDSSFKCLFCDLQFDSIYSLFGHCSSNHCFDFVELKTSLGLDFYGCFKLVNYIRVSVSKNICWSCCHQCKSNQELLSHLHKTNIIGELKRLWDDDKYLQPFMQGDSLLYSFDQDEGFDDDDECFPPVDDEEARRILEEVGNLSINDEDMIDVEGCITNGSDCEVLKELASSSNGFPFVAGSFKGGTVNGAEKKDEPFRVSFANVVASEIRKVNENYFGSYSSFGIHREMLSDKVRMDAYGQAILKNPSLLKGATVLDVGCGTGILSLFAAQAGASRVIAVDASAKMASVATQIAKDNGLLRRNDICGGNEQCSGVFEVVHGMVEDLGKSIQIEPHSVDVLLSEWMGYCLLYESMLTSVLFARDRWLKPGGAILPDTATMFAAGFGKGGTSLPFWDNVYGFDMSCVGKELVEDAAQIPIVDVIDSRDIVTDTALLKRFDLATMKLKDMDFTSCIELKPSSSNTKPIDIKCKPTWCYGVVLWFDTGFTSRFCREMEANLSTSPFTPRTHWSQTILTFKEPISLSSEKIDQDPNGSALIGTHNCPASKLELRVSVVRASQHRAIDISVEISGVAHDGRTRGWPVQIFNLC